jgi:hypothetical protein
VVLAHASENLGNGGRHRRAEVGES